MLCAICENNVVDNGYSPENGHYFAYCRPNDGKQWVTFNDENVITKTNPVITNNAYVLFFRRVYDAPRTITNLMSSDTRCQKLRTSANRAQLGGSASAVILQPVLNISAGKHAVVFNVMHTGNVLTLLVNLSSDSIKYVKQKVVDALCLDGIDVKYVLRHSQNRKDASLSNDTNRLDFFFGNKELKNGKLLCHYNIQENDTVDVVLTEIQDHISLRAVNRKFDFFLPVMKALHLSHVSLKRLLNSESMKDSEFHNYVGLKGYRDNVHDTLNPRQLLASVNFEALIKVHIDEVLAVTGRDQSNLDSQEEMTKDEREKKEISNIMSDMIDSVLELHVTNIDDCFDVRTVIKNSMNWESKTHYTSAIANAHQSNDKYALNSGMVDFQIFFEFVKSHPDISFFADVGCGAAIQMAVVFAIWAFQKKSSFEVRGTEKLFNKCVRSNMLLTALNCSICKLQDKALHGWTGRTDYTGKFLVEYSDQLPAGWTRNQGWFLFNNAKIDSTNLHSEIFKFKPDYLMFFKCDAFESSWVESDKGYQIEAIIVKAANFTPCTLIVLRKEKKEFHESCFEDLLTNFEKIKKETGLDNEVSTLMKQAFNSKEFSLKNTPLPTFQDIILETCNIVFSEKFQNVSTFVFHGSALLLWLIAFEVVDISLHSAQISDLMSTDCDLNLKELLFQRNQDKSVLKSMTCVRRKLFNGQCVRTNGSSMYWFKSDEIWKSDSDTFDKLHAAVASSCTKALRIGKDFDSSVPISKTKNTNTQQSTQSSNTPSNTQQSMQSSNSSNTASNESSGYVPSSAASEENGYPKLRDNNVLFQQFPSIDFHLSKLSNFNFFDESMQFFEAVKIVSLGFYDQIHSKCLSKFLVKHFGDVYFNNTAELSRLRIRPNSNNSNSKECSIDDEKSTTSSSSSSISDATRNCSQILVNLQEYSTEDPFNKMLNKKSKQREAFELQRKQMKTNHSQLPNFFPVNIGFFYDTKFKQTDAEQWCGLLPGEPCSFHNHTLLSPAGIHFFRSLGVLDHLNGIADTTKWKTAFSCSFVLSIVVFSNATFIVVDFIQNQQTGNKPNAEISPDLINLQGFSSYQLISVSTQEKNSDVSGTPHYVKTQQECVVFELQSSGYSKSIDLSRILTRLEDCICTLIFDDKINDKYAVGLHATKLIAVPKKKQVDKLSDNEKGSSSDEDSHDSSSSESSEDSSSGNFSETNFLPENKSSGSDENKKRSRSETDASPSKTQCVYAKTSHPHPLMLPTNDEEDTLLHEKFAADDHQVIVSEPNLLLAVSFKCLMKDESLNDETLNSYVLLVEDAAKTAKCPVNSFSSWFFTKLETVSWGIWGGTCLDLTLFVRQVLTACRLGRRSLVVRRCLIWTSKSVASDL